MSYLARHIDEHLHALFDGLPALELVGPRGVGKTTTARRLARTVVRLDVPAQAMPFRADPDEALAALEKPVLLDEWQEVPEVLGAVKRAVDADFRPGQFILTGSVRAQLDVATWPGTGRIAPLMLGPLTVAEIQGRANCRPFLDVIAQDGVRALNVPKDAPKLRGYINLALRGGLPQAALNESELVRTSWLEGYIAQLVTRDVQAAGEDRDPERLRRFFEVLALNTASVPSEKTLYEAAGINRTTAAAYHRLFQNLLVVEAIPAWFTNRLKRLIKSPKLYLVDTALVATMLNFDVASVVRDGGILGQLIDTFVMQQLRTQLPACRSRPRLFHLRENAGAHEVDLIAEFGANHVVGLEIKADAAPRLAAAKHLVWLRERLGDRFRAGVVLHTGPAIFELDDRIFAVPIAALWGEHS